MNRSDSNDPRALGVLAERPGSAFSRPRRRRPGPLVMAGLVLCAGCGAGPAARPKRLLLVSIDTLRADHLSCYGYGRPTSPNLDAFATTAVRFERAFSTAPYTLVAHQSMLTGLYPSQHRVLDEGESLSPDYPTLAESLKAEGYETGGFYFPGWISPRFGFQRGFDSFVPLQQVTEALEHVETWLSELDPQRSAFCFVHLFDVHCASFEESGPLYQSPPAFIDRFGPNAERTLARFSRRELWDIEPGVLVEDEIQAVTDLYDAAILWTDDRLGVLLEQFERSAAGSDSLILVTADHGETLGRRNGQVNGHGHMLQDGLHIPLLLRAPGLSPGTVDTSVSLVDIAPTLEAFAGAAVDSRCSGESLIDLARTPPPAGTGARLLEARHATTSVLISWPRKSINWNGVRALYLLDVDPGEVAPIYNGASEQAYERQLQRFLDEHGGSLASLTPVPATSLSAPEQVHLEALGYLRGR